MENYFKQIQKKETEKTSGDSYKSSIIPRVLISCLIQNLSKDPEVLPAKTLLLSNETRPKLSFRLAAFIVMKTLKKRDVLLHKDKQQIRQSVKYKQKVKEYEEKILKMAPQIEGRSRLINDEVSFNAYSGIG